MACWGRDHAKGCALFEREEKTVKRRRWCDENGYTGKRIMGVRGSSFDAPSLALCLQYLLGNGCKDHDEDRVCGPVGIIGARGLVHCGGRGEKCTSFMVWSKYAKG